jgi:hypothetical protein
MTKLNITETSLSYQNYNQNTTVKIEERSASSPEPSPESSPSPVRSPSSPENCPINSNVPEDFENFSHLFRLLKELMETIEKKKSQTIPQELVDTVITELSTFSNNKTATKKTVTKKKRERGFLRVCSKCGTSSTPEWRRSPEGSTTLCNACGLKEKKRVKNSIVPSQNYGPNKFHHTSFNQTPNNNNNNNNCNVNPTVSPRIAPQTNTNYNYPYQSSSQVRVHPYYRNQEVGPNYNPRLSAQPPISNLSYYPPVNGDFAQQYFFNGNNNTNSSHNSQMFGEGPECSVLNCPHCPSLNNYSDMGMRVSGGGSLCVPLPIYQQSHV